MCESRGLESVKRRQLLDYLNDEVSVLLLSSLKQEKPTVEFKVEGNKYQLVCVFKTKDQAQKHDYFIFSNHTLGEGSSGTVKLAWKIEFDAQNSLFPYAVKWIPKEKWISNEEKAWKAYDPKLPESLIINNECLLFMPCFFGEQVVSDSGILNPIINQWSLEKRLKLCDRILFKVKKLQECGWLYGDPKGQNIILDKEGEPHLTDFGAMIPVMGDDLMALDKMMASPGHFTSEMVLEQKIGPKTILAALSPELARIVGFVNPSIKKFETDRQVQQKEINDDYEFKGMTAVFASLKKYDPPAPIIQHYLKEFFKQLSSTALTGSVSEKYDQRPNLAEARHFFQALMKKEVRILLIRVDRRFPKLTDRVASILFQNSEESNNFIQKFNAAELKTEQHLSDLCDLYDKKMMTRAQFLSIKQAYLQSGFFGKKTPQGSTKNALNDLEYAPDAFIRYELGQNYINVYPSKAFSKTLSKFIK